MDCNKCHIERVGDFYNRISRRTYARTWVVEQERVNGHATGLVYLLIFPRCYHFVAINNIVAGFKWRND